MQNKLYEAGSYCPRVCSWVECPEVLGMLRSDGPDGRKGYAKALGQKRCFYCSSEHQCGPFSTGSRHRIQGSGVLHCGMPGLLTGDSKTPQPQPLPVSLQLQDPVCRTRRLWCVS